MRSRSNQRLGFPERLPPHNESLRFPSDRYRLSSNIRSEITYVPGCAIDFDLRLRRVCVYIRHPTARRRQLLRREFLSVTFNREYPARIYRMNTRADNIMRYYKDAVLQCDEEAPRRTEEKRGRKKMKKREAPIQESRLLESSMIR